MNGAKFLLSTAVACSLATTAFADWTVEDDWSFLSFVSTKKQHVAEKHVIQGVTGNLSEDGSIEVKIDLRTHTSGVDIRDGRMADILFNVAATPEAVFVGEVNMDEVSVLTVGQSIPVLVEGDLTIGEMDNFVDFEVLATRVSEDRVVVTTVEPVIVDSVDYALDGRIESLRQLAKLDVISLSVPVYFNLSFSR